MRIKVVSDFICPWCYIGWHRLKRALARRSSLATDVQWLPFQLNPGMPAQGMDRQAYILAKFGESARGNAVYDSATRAAAADGIPMHLERITRTPSTLQAHALMRQAEAAGVAGGLAERLFEAALVDGRDIGNAAVLTDLAHQVGMTSVTAEGLTTPEDRQSVRVIDDQLRGLGINAVPCFIFANAFVISGAQDSRAFLPLLDTLSAEAQVQRVG